MAIGSGEPPAHWLHRLTQWGLGWFRKGEADDEPDMTVQEFFGSTKNSLSELKLVESRARGYEEALRAADEAGQAALVERLREGLDGARAETQLIAAGFLMYLEEETLVEFVKKSPRGLRLDWVKNFVRVIPPDVLKKKVVCDERHIFDNWVVLHYDPDGKSWAETQAEIAARKDPILFGVMKGRRRLYFVGEWVDELCDLSLDQIADVLGQEPTNLLQHDMYLEAP